MNECFENEQVMNDDHKMFSATAECLISETADGVMKYFWAKHKSKYAHFMGIALKSC